MTALRVTEIAEQAAFGFPTTRPEASDDRACHVLFLSSTSDGPPISVTQLCSGEDTCLSKSSGLKLKFDEGSL